MIVAYFCINDRNKERKVAAKLRSDTTGNDINKAV